ncbi:hypothetical protein [Acinetobacter sp. ANC 3832]|uniref:hypothetical protein n=1 Tax=Acinetobacter sp. ANC 3832 TaxID=1977874 RepID=UPI000A33CE52|nr:hypothetical protein [Acinetobacter sp. ANC 3832]OTG95790.1 hypothetical protein B9T35_04430 [Acinetobacter sp. ANC 3832]
MRLGWLSLSLMLSITTHAVADSKSTSASSPLQTLLQTKNWGLVQPGTMCIEQYQFLPSGEVLIQSNKERVSGTYSYLEKQQGFELPAVVINFKTDNQQPDCAGNSENQAGTSTTNFIKKESDQKVYFCLDSLGKSCPVYLRPER